MVRAAAKASNYRLEKNAWMDLMFHQIGNLLVYEEYKQ